MRVPFTNFPAQFEADREEILQTVERVLRRGEYILGPEVGAFEQAFATLCGVRHAIGVGSGTDALILALKAVGIGPGDEVIVPPITWISSASSVALIGATPVFVDVREDFLIDPTKIEAAVSPRTKAIMPVHLTGRCADMEAIHAIAARHGLAVIEDAAQAAGARDNGRPAGSLGTVGCFSLHPLKNLSGMGDAGIVTTDDEALAQQMRLLRNHGIRGRHEFVVWGWNSRLDSVQAAILGCRLKRLGQITEQRRRHAARYQAALASLVACPVDRPDEHAIYHLFMIQCEAREGLRRWLAERGIDARVHYPVPIHLQPCSASLGYREGDFPVAEAAARRMLSLPVHQSLAEHDVEYVIESVRAFVRGGR